MKEELDCFLFGEEVHNIIYFHLQQKNYPHFLNADISIFTTFFMLS